MCAAAVRLHEKMSRISNSATALDVSKLFRSELDVINAEEFMKTDPEVVCKNFCSLLCGLVKLSQRPIVSVLDEAALLAFPRTSPTDRKAFAERLVAACCYCRKKKKNCTTGEKLSESVRSIVHVMKPEESLGQSRRRKMLARWRSDESCKMLGSPKKLQAASSSSTDPLQMTVQQISQLWGHGSAPLHINTGEVLDVASSQEIVQPLENTSHTVKLQYMDNSTGVMTRIMEDDSKVLATMIANADGFMHAHFGNEPGIKTEVPALSYARAVCKRPAAAPQTMYSSDEDFSASDAEKPPRQKVAKAKPQAKKKQLAEVQISAKSSEPAKASDGRKPVVYGLMRYQTGAWAVRQKFGIKKQLFQIFKKGKEDDAKRICEAAISRLDQGASEHSVKEWAKAQ